MWTAPAVAWSATKLSLRLGFLTASAALWCKAGMACHIHVTDTSVSSRQRVLQRTVCPQPKSSTIVGEWNHSAPLPDHDRLLFCFPNPLDAECDPDDTLPDNDTDEDAVDLAGDTTHAAAGRFVSPPTVLLPRMFSPFKARPPP